MLEDLEEQEENRDDGGVSPLALGSPALLGTEDKGNDGATSGSAPAEMVDHIDPQTDSASPTPSDASNASDSEIAGDADRSIFQRCSARRRPQIETEEDPVLEETEVGCEAAWSDSDYVMSDEEGKWKALLAELLVCHSVILGKRKRAESDADMAARKRLKINATSTAQRNE
ncbi:uncharacterized protein I303_100643 [Kwoniella dejecticola CBS 10117]|uniref:Uncharacterized protein n=1 Tax=Kwoniella dejecticola CBS 10117 TaxID=1296121 RepID=A0AAJ8KHX7_9TREE